MADNFNNDDNGSFLGTIAGLSPFAAGVGYATREMLKDTRIKVGQSSLEQMAQRAQTVSQTMVRPAGTYGLLNPSVPDRQTIIAMEQAINSLDPIAKRSLNITLSDFDQLSGASLHSAIKSKLSTGTADAQILARRFERNIRVLTRQGTIHQPYMEGGVLKSRVMEPKYIGASPKAIDPRFKALPSNLQKAIKPVAEMLGEYSVAYTSTPELSALGYGSYNIKFMDAPGGTLSMNVPVSVRGTMIEGQTMQTKRIAPSVGILNGKEMRELKREEFFFHEMERSILPDIRSGRLKGRKAIHGAVGELRQKVFGQLETMTNIPFGKMTEAQKLREVVRGQQIDLMVEADRITEGRTGYVAGHRAATGEEMSAAMQRHGLFGGTSPTSAAKARVSKINVATLGLAHEAADFGRSPEKGLREYQLTRAAATRLKQFSGKGRLSYAQLESNSYSQTLKQMNIESLQPSVRAIYVDPDKAGGVLAGLNVREGHMAMSSRLGQALEFETVKPLHVRSMREDLVERLRGGASMITKGSVIGFDEASAPIVAERNMEILGFQESISESKGPHFTLNYRDVQQVRHGDKFFEDVKATALLTEESRMRKSIARQSKNALFQENIGIVLSMDELKKNRAKFRRQMLTSMADADIMGTSQSAFQQLERQWSKAAGLDDILFTQTAMRHAVKQGVSAQQFGSIFGTASYVLGDEGVELARKIGASPAAITAMQEGLASGVARLSYDSPAVFKGAGAQGSIEARINNLLKGEHWGATGQRVSNELQERLMMTSPEKFQIHKELGKTLQSITGELDTGQISRSMSAANYSYESFQRFIEEGGGMLEVGKGQRGIYIPGADVLTKMRPYVTAGGDETIGDLANIYHKIASAGAGLHTQVGASTIDEYQKTLTGEAGELMRHWAPGGKGMGGYARGQILGSQYLRAMSVAAGGEVITDPRTVGVTQAAFDELVGEMGSLYGPDTAESLRRRAAAGQAITGLQMRHPLIGGFSVQPTNIKVVPGEEKQIFLPERNVDIELASGARKNITLGPAVGMAADYDADIVSLSLLSPDTEKMVRKNVLQGNAEFTQRYAEHQVRYQLLKAGRAEGAAGGLTIAEKMAADVRKLGVTQQYVPKLSLEMSKAREALTRFGQGTGAADASMLLEWLEQTPISAKHLSAERVAAGGIEDLMTSLEYGLKHRDRGTLRGVVQDIVGSNEVAAGILNQDIKLSQASARELSNITGANISQTIRGANIDQSIDALVDSLGASEGSMRTHEVLSGRAKRISMHDIATGIKAASNVSGKFSGVSSAMTATSNALGQVGRGILKHHKAIGFGFAGSLALATTLSEPPETVGSMRNTRPMKPMMNVGKAANRMSQENMLPPQQSLGNPTAPNILTARQARIEPPRQKISVAARMGSTQSMADLAGRLSSSGINHNISVNLRDNRQSLDYNTIANKLL